MLNQAVGGFHSSRSVSCHTAPASSLRPAAISSNASVRTDRSPSARALAYRPSLRSGRAGGHQRRAGVGDNPQRLLAPHPARTVHVTPYGCLTRLETAHRVLRRSGASDCPARLARPTDLSLGQA